MNLFPALLTHSNCDAALSRGLLCVPWCINNPVCRGLLTGDNVQIFTDVLDLVLGYIWEEVSELHLQHRGAGDALERLT